MSYKIETLINGLSLGEGPHWDEKNQCLYFTNMTAHKIHKYVPATKTHRSATIGNYNVSIIVPIKGLQSRFLVTLDNKVATIDWDGQSESVSNIKILYEVEHNTPGVFNDGKCDPSGRLWAGTMGHYAETVDSIPDKKGALYSFQNNKVFKHRKEVGISNGLAFNVTLKKMYYADSYRGTVDQYDFDIEKGTIDNVRPIFTRGKHGLEDGLFDGMTIDVEGNLWIAVFGESKVIKIDPRRPETLLETISFPVKTITSVTFGGPNLDELYVTSANFPAYNVTDGFLYRVTGLNSKGVTGDEAVL